MSTNRKGFAPIGIALIVAACVIVIGGAFYYFHRAPVMNNNRGNVPPVATSTPGQPSKKPALYPSAGPIGATVTINGGGFAATGNVVTMNGLTAASLKNLPSPDGKTITFTMPAALGPVCNKSEMCAQFLVDVTPGTAYTIAVLSSDGSSSRTIGALTITGDASGHLPL